MFYTLVLLVLLKNGQKQKRKWYLSEKKTEDKQNSAAMIIPVDGIQTVFPVKLKLQRELCE